MFVLLLLVDDQLLVFLLLQSLYLLLRRFVYALLLVLPVSLSEETLIFVTVGDLNFHCVVFRLQLLDLLLETQLIFR
jgi:hypothetical protein